MANEIVMTKEGYDDLVKELAELKTTRRAEISEKIRIARGFGDLSENSEYDDAGIIIRNDFLYTLQGCSG